MTYITIYVRLVNKKGEEVLSTIVVRDGFALTTFSDLDLDLAKQVYEYDKDQGEDVAFNEKHNAYVKNYGKKTKEEIVKELREQIEQAGGQIIEEKQKERKE